MRRPLAVLLVAAATAVAVPSPAAAGGVLDSPWKRIGQHRPAAPAVPAPVALRPGMVASLDDIRPSGPGLYVPATATTPALRWTGTTCERTPTGAWRLTAHWTATGVAYVDLGQPGTNAAPARVTAGAVRTWTGTITVTGMSGPMPAPLTARLSGSRRIAPAGWTGSITQTRTVVVPDVHSRVTCTG